MLKEGTMRIDAAEYTLYELRTKNIHRFDIVKKGSEFHVDADSVLFSFYRKKRRRVYGDKELYQKYIDTVRTLKNIQGEIISESKWEYGNYIRTVIKGEENCRIITQTKNGEWYREIYEQKDITISMRVLVRDYRIMLIPINSREFVRG
jgi:sugar-specific transcriptional regulator TrmB